ncbi:hypothetical protein J5J10_14550 [Ciceribacter sp. L1K23]|uniref:hypothetical protein n=1 Tax=Ciceribacter sp. L1K23 TaxID=2820276 RepID=UPI001B82DF17|nr:hypothetical protein [Ciceribacter sp. L1K23]MBR0556905.1 hypothetical protein [Ciceribacter sp. L1K23]
MTRNPFIALLAGFVVWSAAFLFLYGLQATGCHLGWHTVDFGGISLLRVLLLVSLIATIGTLLVIRLRLRPAGETGLLARIVNLANLAAVISTFCFVGVAWLTMC